MKRYIFEFKIWRTALSLWVDMVGGFSLAVGGTLILACNIHWGPLNNNEPVCVPNLNPKHTALCWIKKAGWFKF